MCSFLYGWLARNNIATTITFVAASVTNWLDGYSASVPNLLFAMHMNLKYGFGAFLDPIADKIIPLSTLVTNDVNFYTTE